MKTAVVTTTINVPKVLAIYAEYARHSDSSDVDIFVAGDLKTPKAAQDFCADKGYNYLSPADQKKWRSSEIIGWNTDSRRNFAVLEALQWGAELIISIDDDMIPYPSFFACFERLFEGKWSGLQLGEPGFWFDHGQWTDVPARARGLPRSGIYSHKVDSVFDITIGAAQGIILGVPDTDAKTAITFPHIDGVTDILRYGFVTHPQCYSVFNSQVTAFRRELAPGFVQFYGEQGRNTDIFASLFMRNLMRDLGWYTHYGLPMAYHNRTTRDLSKDLEAEKWGIKNIEAFAKELDAWEKNTISPVLCSKVLSGITQDMYSLWFQDCHEAMK